MTLSLSGFCNCNKQSNDGLAHNIFIHKTTPNGSKFSSIINELVGREMRVRGEVALIDCHQKDKISHLWQVYQFCITDKYLVSNTSEKDRGPHTQTDLKVSMSYSENIFRVVDMDFLILFHGLSPSPPLQNQHWSGHYTKQVWNKWCAKKGEVVYSSFMAMLLILILR